MTYLSQSVTCQCSRAQCALPLCPKMKFQEALTGRTSRYFWIGTTWRKSHQACQIVHQEDNAQWVSRWTLPKLLSFALSYPFYSFYHPHRYSTDTFSRILKNSSPLNSKVHSAVTANVTRQPSCRLCTTYQRIFLSSKSMQI